MISSGEDLMAEKGQEVHVHYEGRLEDGSVFDSSYDRGDPL
jgi:FKBP-type peptidyl-prolyl cis-trans isomerase